MIDLENKKERDKLIDDYFNKGKECDIKEVYQAIVNSTGDLEYEVDKLKNIIKEVREFIEDDRLYMSNGNVLSIANTGCGKKILEILDKEED